MSEEDFSWSFRCPNCFLHWHKVKSKPQTPRVEDELCGYCRGNELNLGQLVDRQIEVMEEASISDFPDIVKNMWNYIRGDLPDAI